jgi:pyruvate-formate lyase-activating enzyme
MAQRRSCVKLLASSRPPRLLRLMVAEECNLNCVYCCWRSDEVKQLRVAAISPRAYEWIVKAAIQSGQFRRVMLTGGEPLILSSRRLAAIIGVVAGLRRDGLNRFWLCTNGTFLRAKARMLADAGLTEVSVSLAATDDQLYRNYTRSTGSVGQILAGVERAANGGLAVRIDVPVFRGGVDSPELMRQLIALAKSAGARCLGYFRLHKTRANARTFGALYSDVDHITLALRSSPGWHPRMLADGLVCLEDRDGFRVNLPCKIRRTTANCKRRNCGEYCQGVYAAYLQGTVVRFCHREFASRVNELNIACLLREHDDVGMVEAFKRAAAWS